MEELTVWIMGIGPVLSNQQFIKDIGRRSVNWYLNNRPLPWNDRDALQRLYEECGNKYYIFSKYINQTMGNMMYEHVKRMHWKDAIVQVPNTYVINATSKPCNKIFAEIYFNLFDENLKLCGKIHVISLFDIDVNQTTIKVRKN